MTPLLKVQRLAKRFGGVQALNDIDFEVGTNEVVSVIGPNGAGKTTLFNLITGITQPNEGSITFAGKELLHRTPIRGLPFIDRGKRSSSEIARAGIARTFQNIRLFPDMTALENTLVGIDAHAGVGLVDVLFSSSRQKREAAEGRQAATELLSFCGIGQLSSRLARTLPYGDQRRLEIARALGTHPRLLLLDEPAAGMNPTEKAGLIDLIQRIKGIGVTMLLIEHEMNIVMQSSDRVIVLDFGQKIAEGRPAEVQADPRVIEAYLGASTSSPKTPPPAATPSAARAEAPLLEVKDLNVRYGAIQAVADVSLQIQKGEIVCLIGNNGAGKTTVLKTVSGIKSPTRGSITFAGSEISGLPPHRILRLGIAHSPEGRKVLGKMSIFENLQLAYRGAAGRSRDVTRQAQAFSRVYDLLPLLRDRSRDLAGTLSGGQQQMLAIGRALIGDPTLLILDEPSMGLAPMMVERIFDIITAVSRQGTTVLLVEQNANMALAISSRGYVLESGRIVLTGTRDGLLGNDQVRSAYLGAVTEEARHG